MNRLNKRLPQALVVALSLAMLLSMTVFAAWEVYQGNDNHNGRITDAASPTSGSPTATAISLPYTSGSIWSGVDTTPVMETTSGTTYAYVIYNGNTASGANGGARLAKINCSTGAITWNLQLDTSSGFQLSTPYLDTANRCVYAATNAGAVYKVTGIDTTPSATAIFTGASGQINTPIVKYGNYIYFGSWVSNGTPGGATAPGDYYQVDVSGSPYTSASVTSGGARGFYWAGAIVVNVGGTDYVVFGGDDNMLYYRSVGSFASVGGSHNLSTLGGVTAGNVRSSISTDGTYLYFTSQGGYIWRVTISTLTSGTPTVSKQSLGGTSTSTPAISVNGKIYVGYYSGFSSGGVKVINQSTFGAASSVNTVGPVQSSVIVYSPNSTYDYVYFTTNAGAGSGYCYRFTISSSASASVWSRPTSGGNYTLQGMAASNGYLTFGNDANSFYVIH